MTRPNGNSGHVLRFLSLLVLAVLGATMTTMRFLQDQSTQARQTSMTTPQQRAHELPPSTGGRGTKRCDQRERSHDDSTQTENRPGPVQLDRSRLPILVMGMPKSGTSSLNHYFKDCGGQASIHLWCSPIGSIGLAMRDNARSGREPLHGIYPEYVDVLTQMDFVSPPNKCFFPQVELLEEIHSAYPNATFILNTRNVSDWITSVSNWHGMAGRIGRCNITGFPPPDRGSIYERMALFYRWHIRRVEQFVERHPSHQLVKFDIYAEDAGRILHEAFGIDEKCWGQHNSNPGNEKARTARKQGNTTAKR